VARAAAPERAAKVFAWRDTQDIRDEIERVCPTYRGIAGLRQKGDNFQYGGARLLEERFQTPDGKGHFSAIGLPGDEVPEGRFTISTRRGKQFNAMVQADFDAITGLHRDEILMAREDAEALELEDGEAILVRNSHGEYRGRVKIARIKPGCLQGHWPELNVVVPGGCLDPSGVPDYNAIVDVIPVDRAVPAGQVAVVAAEEA